MTKRLMIFVFIVAAIIAVKMTNAQSDPDDSDSDSSDVSDSNSSEASGSARRCTARCTGGSNDRCTLCGTACPLTCDRPEAGVCTRQCVVNVCRCDEGYVRNSNGRCVRPSECPRRNEPECTRRCTGGRHDRCTLCGSACPRTCERPDPRICTLQCLVNVCECERGYVRAPNGRCIREDRCPRIRPQ